MPSYGLTRARSGARRAPHIARFTIAAAAVLGTFAGAAGATGAAAAPTVAPVATPVTAVAGPLAPSALAPTRDAATVLQVNLCGSGADKDCYVQGKSVKAATALVNDVKPQVLTLNEACSQDVDALFEVMRRANPTSSVHSSFSPVRHANGNYIGCATGGYYGSAVIDSLEQMTSYNAWTYTFKDQFKGDERRLANCSMVNSSDNAGFFTCAVQMSEKNKATATAQCKQLVESIMDQVAGKSDLPILATGTYNLRAAGKNSIAVCMEDVVGDYTTAGKGVQHIVASLGITVDEVTTHKLEGTKVPGTAFDINFDDDDDDDDGEGRR